jgi:hypothetical protein
MDNELNEAYELIKQGETERAIAILETYIRTNRDSDDAWWLYANAVDDPDRKRNALNNILRIGTNPAREEKVNYMLAQLDDPFALPEQYDLPAKRGGEKKGMSTGLKIVIGLIVLFGVCACVSAFGIGTIFSRVAYAPANYERLGTIEMSDTVTGYVDAQGDWDGYTYAAQGGENLVITVNAQNADFAPYIFLYGPDNMLVDISDQNNMNRNRLQANLLQPGEYTIIVRTFLGIGTGEYSLSLQSE